MKTLTTTALLSAFLLIWIGDISATAQGTITFSQLELGSPTQNYYEQGFWFRVVGPSNLPPVASMAYGIGNPTPGMLFGQSGTNQTDSVSFSMPGGEPFGLVSVDLHNYFDLFISVRFDGYREDGTVISSVFTLPYGQPFSTYQFDAGFSSGLVRVDIPSSRWQMDNVVWVPEPSSYALLGLGLLAYVLRRFRQRRKL